MTTSEPRHKIVIAGDVEGRSRVYDAQGNLLLRPGESLLKVSQGWDMTAQTPWRRWLPQIIFLGLNKPASSRLYVTTTRVVLIRDIDPLRETLGDMTPLGMPDAVARGVELKRLNSAGIRQFCEVRTADLKVSRIRRPRKSVTWLGLDLLGKDGFRYRISYWKTDGEDPEMLALIESRFRC